MTASQADLDPHSPTTNGLFTIPQLFRIQTTLEPSKSAPTLLPGLEGYHSSCPDSNWCDVEHRLRIMTHA